MKRVVTILMILMSLVPAFATSKPSVDGRAVVADEGVLPHGLFAKTVGYLPGDSVSVTNPATGVTISVLVLGSVDPSTGIAILLSPEAADKLFITKNTNVQVKITKRTGLLDESATGNAILNADPDKDSAAAIPEEIKNTLDAAQAEAAETAPAAAEIAAEESPAAEAELAPAENTTAIAETETPEVPAEIAPAAIEPAPVAIAETAPAAAETIAPETALAASSETSSSETAPSETEPADDDLFDPFAPIILVPANENPPEPHEVPAAGDHAIVICPEPVEPAEAGSIESEKLPPAADVPSASGKSEKAKISAGGTIIPSLKELTSGSYYIQIATLAQEDNINAIIETYGIKYPIVLVPLKSGSAYQIMIGPLSVDEYGTVLARFKSYGYKDAFLRKIK
ncbi:SPOR domain-containing protein [Treponema brennaborense]|uniref:Sporulation domain-containing protein n=1 Tax=Treponema brennaborense (strain DSM 12168 / CIP 105900 / DD5/3) TaxID=906968 RepID=F4LQH2_TREBD|nr:SPOR domain-containing protein [Treponema brennaborense]AEE17181.1 Sporulation domain-containing protein [Treponema brennaborense DSM 12168]